MLVHMPSGHHFESAQRERCFVAEPSLLLNTRIFPRNDLCSLWGEGKWQRKHHGGEGEHNRSIETLARTACINLCLSESQNPIVIDALEMLCS